ncbi:MAG: hypothetical protein A07HR67_00366, partial [uncultured archaeon A07HR67]
TMRCPGVGGWVDGGGAPSTIRFF